MNRALFVQWVQSNPEVPLAVIGPATYTVMVSPDRKQTIELFGEYHASFSNANEKCNAAGYKAASICEFFNELQTKHTECDIFIEHTAGLIKLPQSITHESCMGSKHVQIGALNNMLIAHKHKDPVTRIHFADARHEVTLSIGLIAVYLIELIEKTEAYYISNGSTAIPVMNRIHTRPILATLRNLSNGYIPLIIVKQLRKIQTRRKRCIEAHITELRPFWFHIMNTFTDSIKRIDNILQQFQNDVFACNKTEIHYLVNTQKHLLYNISNAAIAIESMWMDLYTSSRIMKYSTKRSYLKQTLIYAGNAHCRNVYKILESCGYKDVSKTHLLQRGDFHMLTYTNWIKSNAFINENLKEVQGEFCLKYRNRR